MSTGAFQIAKYQTDKGVVHPCKIQPETFELSIGGQLNAQPITPATGVGSARMSSSQKRRGINARTVRFKFNAAFQEYELGSTLTLPVFIKANWDNYNMGDAGTYQGAAITVVGKSPEGIK
jgi:hypothetical protein